MHKQQTGSPWTPPPGVDFGWRAHQAIQEWTRSVDAKASIVLTFETVVAAVAARELAKDTGAFANATGFKLAIAIAIGALLGVAVLAAVSVVLPRLARRRTRKHYAHGLIYFGHLRLRSVDDIAKALEGLEDGRVIRQLASQLSVTSKVAWRKHASLQLSITCFVLGALGLVAGLIGY
jgi:hypothetical protein